MATVTMPDIVTPKQTLDDGTVVPATTTPGAVVHVDDADTGLLDYYRGQGASIKVGSSVSVSEFPKSFENNEPVAPVEQPADDVPALTDDTTAIAGDGGDAGDVSTVDAEPVPDPGPKPSPN